VRLPRALAEALERASVEVAKWPFTPSVARGEAATDYLITELLNLLRLPASLHAATLVTFSGSVALDRAITVSAHLHDHWLIVSPVFDVIPSLIAEQPWVRPTYINPFTANGAWDLGRLVAYIRESRPKVMIMVSPSNPLGASLSVLELQTLMTSCRDAGTLLVLDQCLYALNPFEIHIPLLPSLDIEGLSWILTWDTAKTFGLNDEKLGFIFASSDLAPKLRESLDIIQIDVSARSKLLFAELFRAARLTDYPKYLSDLVARNWHTCRSLSSVGVHVSTPQAGSFALLDVTELGLSAPQAQEIFMSSAEVGMVDAGEFYFWDPLREPWVARARDSLCRIALAREAATIEDALERIRVVAAEIAG